MFGIYYVLHLIDNIREWTNVFFWGVHIWQFSGFTPGSVLRVYFWLWSYVNICVDSNESCLAACKVSILPTTLYLWLRMFSFYDKNLNASLVDSQY